jgi:replicative DNA helicase
MSQGKKAPDGSDPSKLAIQAEQLVIGAILQKPGLLHVISLRREDFISDLYGRAFEACEALSIAGGPIDEFAVVQRLRGRFTGDDWIERLNDAMHYCYAPNNAPLYAERVKAAAAGRRARAIAQRLSEAPDDAVLGVIDEVINELRQLVSVKTGTVMHIREAATQALARIDEMYQRPDVLPGIPTGLADLDEHLGGLRDGDLYVIGARPSVGKTAFMLSLAIAAAQKGNVPVGIITAEQPGEQIAMRLFSIIGRIDSAKVRKGRLDDNDWSKLTSAAGIVAGMKIWLDEKPAPSIAELSRQAREWYYKENIRVLFVDYIQRIEPANERIPRHEQIAQVTMCLKELARELKIPVVALAQINRAVDSRIDKRPTMGDLKDSGTIEQEADTLMTLYRDEVYNPDTPDKGIAEIVIAKNRHGERVTLRCAWFGQYFQFKDYAFRYRNDE